MGLILVLAFRAGLPRTGLDGRLRPRLRALRDETWRAEAPLQRGTEPATQAQRPPPLLPGASRAAALRVRRSGHRLGCGRPEGWGLQGRPHAAARDLQPAEFGRSGGSKRPASRLERRAESLASPRDTDTMHELRPISLGLTTSCLSPTLQQQRTRGKKSRAFSGSA